MQVINLGLRIFQFMCALIVMALVGNMIAQNAGPAVVNYSMFCAAFGMFSLFYLIPVAINESWAGMAMIPFIIDLLIVIFWFCAGVAMASELHVHSCYDYGYTHSNYIIRGANDPEGACREGQASTAFLWFGWAAWVGSTVFSGLALRGGSSSSGGIKRGPAMSQV